MQNRANKSVFWVKWDKIRISAKDQVVPVECPILGWQDGNGNGNRGANGSEKAAAQKQGERWILVEMLRQIMQPADFAEKAHPNSSADYGS